MFFKKLGLPEEGEIVLCTVKKVLFHSVFVSLDEYQGDIEGMIHISEIAPGRIRNIRDYVKEDKKIVCKVLRKKEKNIDLSLRRVPLIARKNKNEEAKLEIKAENIIKFVSEKLKSGNLFEKIDSNLIIEYGSLHNLFKESLDDPEILKELKLPKKETDLILETIKERIKPPIIEISGTLRLESTKPNGIELIKEALKKAEELVKKEKYDITFSYLGAPKYKISINAQDYKEGEKGLQKVVDLIKKEIEKSQGSAEFIREKNE